MENMIGIYQIVNTKNNKRYVGQSVDVRRRLAWHRSVLFSGQHDNEHLLRSWNRHGPDAFRFELLLTCNVEHLTFFEQEAYDFFNPIYGCYNEGPFLDNPTRGKKRPPFSEAMRRNMSIAHKGKTHSDETRRKISAANKGQVPWSKGKTLPSPSEETRHKMSVAGKKKVFSLEHRQNIGLASTGRTPWIKGKTHSKETKQKMSKAKKGNTNRLGTHHSNETKLKMSITRKGRIPWNKGISSSKETIHKQSESMKILLAKRRSEEKA